MVGDCFVLFKTAFTACVGWLDAILVRLDAVLYIIGGVAILLICSLFIKPIRGGKFAIDHFTGSKGSKKG